MSPRSHLDLSASTDTLLQHQYGSVEGPKQHTVRGPVHAGPWPTLAARVDWEGSVCALPGVGVGLRHQGDSECRKGAFPGKVWVSNSLLCQGSSYLPAPLSRAQPFVGHHPRPLHVAGSPREQGPGLNITGSLVFSTAEVGGAASNQQWAALWCPSSWSSLGTGGGGAAASLGESRELD